MGMTASLISIKKDMEREIASCVTKYNHVDKWIKAVEEVHEDIVLENNKQDLIIVEIRTKLANIEAILADINSRI